jgi:hypothetical protein
MPDIVIHANNTDEIEPGVQVGWVVYVDSIAGSYTFPAVMMADPDGETLTVVAEVPEDWTP